VYGKAFNVVPAVCVTVALNLALYASVDAGILTTGMFCVPVKVNSSVFCWFAPSTAMYVLIITVSPEARFCRLICPSRM
jgi:hypothetical protein